MFATSHKSDQRLTSLHTLSNGVRVICDPMPGLETVALSVVAGRGSRHEDLARSGWSHLLEHMVFKGAGERSAKDIVEAIEAQGGQINAATGYERTSFQVRALAGGLDLGSAVLADLVQRPKIDAGDLAREKLVVGQEIAEAADTPDDLVFEMAQEASFEHQALGRSVLGTDATIAPATSQTLEAWRAALYAPDSLVVSASGAVNEVEVLALAERDFGRAAGKAPPPFENAQFTAGARAGIKALEQANLVFMLPTVGVRHPDYYALRLFAEILGGGMASRLFQEAREKRGLAYAVDAYVETYEDQGVFGVFAGCAAKDAAELAQVAAQQIIGLASQVLPSELARAKAQLKSGLFMARESPLARAEQAAGQVLLFDRLLTTAEIAADIDGVEATDLARVGAHMLARGMSAVSILGPRPALKAEHAFRASLAAG
jgi:predicted Zn-dependent peptidase